MATKKKKPSTKKKTVKKGEWLDRNRKKVNIAIMIVILVAVSGYFGYNYQKNQKYAEYKAAAVGWTNAINDCDYKDYIKYDYFKRLVSEGVNEEDGADVYASLGSEKFKEQCKASNEQGKYKFVRVIKESNEGGKRTVNFLFEQQPNNSATANQQGLQVIVSEMPVNEDGSKKAFVVLGVVPYFGDPQEAGKTKN